MSPETVIQVRNIGKCYHIYEKPHERMLQVLMRSRKKYYREFWALNDVSFDVRKGETIGIIGRNGSGKSTLLQMICGTLTPTQGTIKTKGRIAALLELGSGFNPEFTGRENVYMNGTIYGLSKKEIDNRYQDICDFADIGDFIEQPVKTYSSGMMVRLAFAVIAHVDADIIVIDEALAVGDAFFTQKCMRFLRQFMQKGTVLFVSHDTASVRNLCNRAIWIEKGSIVQEGSPKEVCDQYLEAFYEVQQGKSNSIEFKTKALDDIHTFIDQRLVYINQSNLRNDLRVFKFDPDAASFGKGGAQIYDVRLLNQKGESLAWIVGGEKVTLHITAKANQDLHSPIIGFYIKDRLGQTLFGDNTFLTYSSETVVCAQNSIIHADFVFYMPLLPCGEYSINVAIASGSQETHEQHHWIHDALFFKSESSSVSSGLVGIPMQEIKLNVLEEIDTSYVS
ncbi:ABC transporter ATP-binding protein [Legionella fallonii]|uniref:ABC-type polysaccharide/polyol phosphate transport system, ATPase component n=1 Tax=Legionella fallonii LLAP-10 TaxID=1212491 RepID=A0A098GAD8_9GAMM|nr:ABC transporter ATP-binding protein [Legionella fallonii]CEG58985.1 ABC-type polysaccharide/polyol phosphate transport system, ATPase component [Legionella fallonii LLAP-10]